MEKEHKIRVKWTLETPMDLQDFEGSDLQKRINDEVDRQIIETFGSWENFKATLNNPKPKVSVKYKN